jgi:hypothetical protein
MSESAASGGVSRSWITSILGFVLAFVVPIAGLVVSIIALVTSSRSHEGANKFAVAGLIISIVVLALQIIAFVVIVVSITHSGGSCIGMPNGTYDLGGGAKLTCLPGHVG